MSDNVHDKKLIAQFFKKAHTYNWTCMAPKCKQKTIASHVLQKNGILSNISTNRHLIEVMPSSIWEIEEEGILKFQEIGINEAFTFPGFCPHHDNSIFKQIESNKIDFESYKVQLLFSYRGLCQEIRRKQIVKLFLGDLLREETEFTIINVNNVFKDYRDGLEVGIRNLNFFKKCIEEDLKKNSKSFTFAYHTLPYVEICTSAPINIKERNERNYSTIDEYRKITLRNKLPTTFVSIFPYEKISIWIIGDHKQFKSSYTKRIAEEDWRQTLSDLLIFRMEYWCMSHKFFDVYIKPRLEEIKKAYISNAFNFELDIHSSIDLFK